MYPETRAKPPAPNTANAAQQSRPPLQQQQLLPRAVPTESSAATRRARQSPDGRLSALQSPPLPAVLALDLSNLTCCHHTSPFFYNKNASDGIPGPLYKPESSGLAASSPPDHHLDPLV